MDWIKINRYSFFILIVFAVFALSSCAKIQERKIIKGRWELKHFKFGPTEQNWMELVLPGYEVGTNCCRYIINFKDNNTCSGIYYRNDSLIYSVIGDWHMVGRDVLYVNLDDYADAEFYINRHNRRDYTLEADSNSVELSPSVHLVEPASLEIKRIDI